MGSSALHTFYVAFWEPWRPLALVDDPGFHRVIEYVASLGSRRVTVLGRTQVREEIQTLAEEYSQAVRGKIIQGCESVAITSDMWTDRCTRGYMALTVHYIDKGFVAHNYTLEVERFSGSHTSFSIGSELHSYLIAWRLQREFWIAFVRDGASNAVGVAIELGFPDWHCTLHCLQLVIAGCLYSKPSRAVEEGAEAYIEAYDAGDSDDIGQDTLNAPRISAILDVRGFVHTNISGNLRRQEIVLSPFRWTNSTSVDRTPFVSRSTSPRVGVQPSTC